MKKLSTIILLTVILFLSGNAFAAITTFNSNVIELDHSYYYSWRIEPDQATDETIISASLKFVDIRNWNADPHDLRVHLLDTPIGIDNIPDEPWGTWTQLGEGVWKHWDYQYSATDAFAYNTEWYGATSLLFHYDEDTRFSWDSVNSTLYEDENGGDHFPAVPDAAKTVTYYFNANDLVSLNEFWENDGKLGIGFDPDCHYYNGGIYLDVEFGTGSTPVPEPATLILMGVGLIGMASFSRKKLSSRP